jgi:hypothetical protein
VLTCACRRRAASLCIAVMFAVSGAVFSVCASFFSSTVAFPVPLSPRRKLIGPMFSSFAAALLLLDLEAVLLGNLLCLAAFFSQGASCSTSSFGSSSRRLWMRCFGSKRVWLKTSVLSSSEGTSHVSFARAGDFFAVGSAPGLLACGFDCGLDCDLGCAAGSTLGSASVCGTTGFTGRVGMVVLYFLEA